MPPSYSSETLKNFIVVEGLDGAGTSTQSAMLEKRLRDAGYKVALSSEPTTGPTGVLIRQIMRGRLLFSKDRRETERQLAYLFAADRHDHLYNETDGIVEQIRKGYLAISTRYFFSSYAYNANGSDGIEFVGRLNRDFPLPQVVVYLRVPVEVSLGRIQRRDVHEFYERREELLRVAESYERVLEPLGDRVVYANSDGPREAVSEGIFEQVKARLQAEG